MHLLLMRVLVLVNFTDSRHLDCFSSRVLKMGLVCVYAVLTLCIMSGVMGNNNHKANVVKKARNRCLSFQDTMNTCMAPLGGSLGLQPGDEHELLSDLNITKKLCQEGKLQDAMACLEEVFNGCAAASKAYGYRKQRQIPGQHSPPGSLNLMMSNGNWKNSMERLCTNIDYLKKHEQCTRVMAVESSHCIRNESKLFMEKATRILTKAIRRGKTGHKQLMDLGCQFAQEVNMCFQHALNREVHCPCRYRHLIVKIVLDSMPPFCQPDQDYYYYAYSDCIDYDDDDDDFNDDNIIDDDDSMGIFGNDPGPSYNNGAKLSKGKLVQGEAGGNKNPGSSLHKGGSKEPKVVDEVVVVQKPVRMGKGRGKGSYKVHDVGRIQGQLGDSAAGAVVGVGGYINVGFLVGVLGVLSRLMMLMRYP